MIVAYLSLTGNVEKFVEGLNVDSVEIDYSNPQVAVNEKYLLVVPTYDEELTSIISEFIEYEENLSYLVGIVGSGNRNFDSSFCFNAVEISDKYNKELIAKIEFDGANDDITKIKEVLKIGIPTTKAQQ